MLIKKIEKGEFLFNASWIVVDKLGLCFFLNFLLTMCVNQVMIIKVHTLYMKDPSFASFFFL